MNHEPLPGRIAGASYCPICHTRSGPDCITRGTTKRAIRRAARTEIARQLAEETPA